jgi:uncharacterized protein YqeY
MALKGEIRNSMISATKSRDLVALSTLRMLLAAIKNREIELRGEVDDTEVLKIISTMIKQRNEAVGMYEKGGREDLASKEREEITVLEEYLPPKIDTSELKTLVESVVADMGASGMKDMGKVMKTVMPRLTGRVEGKEVSEVVKNILSGS